jgi:hypothetical protein
MRMITAAEKRATEKYKGVDSGGYPREGLHVKPTAWDAWLESRPDSSPLRIEDRRTPEQTAADNELMRRWVGALAPPPLTPYEEVQKKYGRPFRYDEFPPELFPPPQRVEPTWIDKNGQPISPPPTHDAYGYGPQVHINPANWDAWLAARLPSENIEDRRTPEDVALDNPPRRKRK